MAKGKDKKYFVLKDGTGWTVVREDVEDAFEVFLKKHASGEDVELTYGNDDSFVEIFITLKAKPVH